MTNKLTGYVRYAYKYILYMPIYTYLLSIYCYIYYNIL
jgi:hypothetical protein